MNLKECLIPANALGEDLNHRSIWPAASFLNKILLKHNYTLLFIYCVGLLLYYKAELNSCSTDHIACKV